MVIAIDLGASNIRSAQVAGKTIRNKKIIKTPKTKKEIEQALFSLLDSYEEKKIICVGVASFMRKGNTIGTPNMDFAHENIISLLKNKYRAKVFVENDAKCAGLAELYFGNGKGKKNFVVITLGTGIGGALIVNGKLYEGESFAGEVGQLIVHGKRLEELASGPATEKLAQQRGLTANNVRLKQLADKGDRKVLALYKEVGGYLGVGLANVAYIVDPEVIILGGGFSNVSQIITQARIVFHKLDIIKRNIPVVGAQFKDDGGLIGAALLCKQTL